MAEDIKQKEKRSPIFSITIEIAQEKHHLHIFKYDTPPQIAYRFCIQNNWDLACVTPVSRKIQEVFEEYLRNPQLEHKLRRKLEQIIPNDQKNQQPLPQQEIQKMEDSFKAQKERITELKKQQKEQVDNIQPCTDQNLIQSSQQLQMETKENTNKLSLDRKQIQEQQTKRKTQELKNYLMAQQTQNMSELLQGQLLNTTKYTTQNKNFSPPIQQNLNQQFNNSKGEKMTISESTIKTKDIANVQNNGSNSSCTLTGNSQNSVQRKYFNYNHISTQLQQKVLQQLEAQRQTTDKKKRSHSLDNNTQSHSSIKNIQKMKPEQQYFINDQNYQNGFIYQSTLKKDQFTSLKDQFNTLRDRKINDQADFVNYNSCDRIKIHQGFPMNRQIFSKQYDQQQFLSSEKSKSQSLGRRNPHHSNSQQKRQMTQTCISGSLSPKGFQHNLYDRGVHFLDQKQNKIEQFKQNRQERIMSSCTFIPKINQKINDQLLQYRDKTINPYDQLYQNSKIIEMKKELIKNKLQTEECKEFSFKPALNPVSKLIMKKKNLGSISDKSSNFEVQKNAKINQLQQEMLKECTFHPQISKQSEKLHRSHQSNLNVYERLYINTNSKQAKENNINESNYLSNVKKSNKKINQTCDENSNYIMNCTYVDSNQSYQNNSSYCCQNTNNHSCQMNNNNASLNNSFQNKNCFNNNNSNQNIYQNINYTNVNLQSDDIQNQDLNYINRIQQKCQDNEQFIQHENNYQYLQENPNYSFSQDKYLSEQNSVQFPQNNENFQNDFLNNSQQNNHKPQLFCKNGLTQVNEQPHQSINLQNYLSQNQYNNFNNQCQMNQSDFIISQTQVNGSVDQKQESFINQSQDSCFQNKSSQHNINNPYIHSCIKNFGKVNLDSQNNKIQSIDNMQCRISENKKHSNSSVNSQCKKGMCCSSINTMQSSLCSSKACQIDKIHQESKEKDKQLKNRRDSDKINQKQNFSPNKNSVALMLKKKRQRFEEIFALLDSDKDGLISAQNISIQQLPDEILIIIAPLLYELEDLDAELTLVDFIDAFERLFKQLTLIEKNKLLLFDIYQKWEQEKQYLHTKDLNFQPQINPHSEVIAQISRPDRGSENLYDLYKEKDRQCEEKLMQKRREKENEITSQCTFHPNILQNTMQIKSLKEQNNLNSCQKSFQSFLQNHSKII